MAVQLVERIILPTASGQADAVRLAGDLWRLKTPWAEELFRGPKEGAFRRLRAMVWEAEANPEHNSVNQAVRESIRYLKQGLRRPNTSRTLGPEACPETTTLVSGPLPHTV